MQVSLTKTAAQNFLALLDAVNAKAPTSLTQFTTSIPQVDTLAGDSQVNTSVVLTGVAGKGFSGTQKVYYRRLTLAQELASPTAQMTLTVNSLTAAATLAAILNYYGFLASEITASFTPSKVAGTQTITLQASGSLVYADGTANVTIKWITVNTVLLMHMEDMTDDAGHTGIVSSGVAALSATQAKFGAKSASFAGGSGGTTYFSVPASTDFQWTNAQDFTIEYFHFMTALSADYAVINRNLVTAAVASRAWIEYNGNQPQYKGDASTSAGAVVVGANAGLLTNQWQHIAWVKKASTNSLLFFVDGVLKGTLTGVTTSWGTVGGPLIIGSGGGTSMSGYMDELRISKIARYSANFTPPSAPFLLD